MGGRGKETWTSDPSVQVDAIPALTTDKAVKLFESFNVFTRAELESRAEIQYEGYATAINIEAKTMVDVATKQIIPAVIRYTTVLAESINSVKAVSAALDVSCLLYTSDAADE